MRSAPFFSASPPTPAKPAFPPNYFHFCISAFWPPKPLLPSLYKAFFAVKNPVFDTHFIRTVRSRFFRTMLSLSHDYEKINKETEFASHDAASAWPATSAFRILHSAFCLLPPAAAPTVRPVSRLREALIRDISRYFELI
jgi:hypothetical protein